MMRYRTAPALLPALWLAAAAEPRRPAGAAVLLVTRFDWTFWLALVIAIAAIAALARAVHRALHSRAGEADHGGPFIVFPVPAPGAREDERAVFTPRHPLATAAGPAAARPAARAAVPEPEHAPPDVFEGHTVRFFIPTTDGTLQLLPGRLEVVGGPDTGQEIRFVRAPDGPQEITFGRSDGPPHRHVQLRAGTVSRAHARMLFDDGAWTIYNLSRTNPVVLNDEELEGEATGHVLSDGDRIEMGEVVFTFRAR